MTTNLLKLGLSVLMTGIAATAAVNTQQSTAVDQTPNERGFIRHTSATDCELSDMCNPSGTDFCTVGNVSAGARLWRKNVNQQCIVPLYKPQL